MPEVTVIGAGPAGLTAALRLSERGFDVTVLEQDAIVGGKFGGHINPTSGEFHEHSYHMFLNWYRHFWQIIDELGLRDRFVPRSALKYVRKGEFPKMTQLTNVGSPEHLMENLSSGVMSPADLWIYGYSLLDLLTQPLRRGEFLGMISVNGFMASRPYQTGAAAFHHHRTLAKAFASYSFNTSASTYKTFIKFGFRDPSPMTWVLAGNCFEHFLEPLEKKLIEQGCKIRKLCRVERLRLDETGRVRQLEVANLDRSPSEHAAGEVNELSRETLDVNDSIVLAVPPSAAASLFDEAVLERAPELGRVEKLHSEPMASLDLYFRRTLPNIPKEHVVLLGSDHHLTFIDNSQLWPGLEHTMLNVVASETFGFYALSNERAMRLIIDELREYIPFTDDDIDFERSYLQTNTGDQLMVHEVGSWAMRPRTRSAIRNMYLAGDYCQTYVDVVTIEGAVVSGLLAAEAIRSQHGIGTPIEIKEPEAFSEAELTMWKWALAPLALAAKSATISEDELLRLTSLGRSQID